jgi:osmotically-inducible protein OsmY
MTIDGDIRRAVAANNIPVGITQSGTRTDTDIADAAAHALQWNISLSHAQIEPSIKSGWVTLGGKVRWDYQRIAAENAIRGLVGVRGVTNGIRVASNT